MASLTTANITIKDAVIGLELSDTDAALLNYYRFFSRLLDVKNTTILHVAPALFEPIGAMFPPPSIPVDEAFEKEVRECIDKMLGGEPIGSGELQVAVRNGAALDELVGLSKEMEADLAVIGKRKNTEWHAILAKNLVRQLKAKVLLVPEGAKPLLRTILVPVDFSEYSVRALEMALSIRERSDLEVAIKAINIYQRPNIPSYQVDKTPAQFEKMVQENHLEGFESFIKEHFPERGEFIEPVLIQNKDYNIAESLLSHADEMEADLIIMGAKGHSRLSVFLLGSTTESVLDKNYSIPVLVVK